MHEPLAWSDFHTYARVAVARIPPVVPDAGLDDGGLVLMKGTGLPFALYRQRTVEHGELLNESGMAVFPITRAPTSAVNSAVARPSGLSALQNRGGFPVNGVLPDVPDPDWAAIRGASASGCEMPITNYESSTLDNTISEPA